MAKCSHLDRVAEVGPSSNGCYECLQTGASWVHLRICMTCGHVGCCNNSIGKHAAAHYESNPDHPVIRSFEPGEDWWWCYPEALFFYVDGAPSAPSYTPAD